MTEEESSALKTALSSDILSKTESILTRQKHRYACIHLAVQVMSNAPVGIFNDSALFSLADKIDQWIRNPYDVETTKDQEDPLP